MSGEEVSVDKLAARDMASAVNSEALLQEHALRNGSIVRTRFPPEPNGTSLVTLCGRLLMCYTRRIPPLGTLQVHVHELPAVFREAWSAIGASRNNISL